MNFDRQSGATLYRLVPYAQWLAAREHPNHKADLNYDSETGFRYVFRHRDDPDRELTLTVLVFDIPG